MDLQGELDSFGLPDTLAMLCQLQKSGVLRVSSGEDQLVVYLWNGEVGQCHLAVDALPVGLPCRIPAAAEVASHQVTDSSRPLMLQTLADCLEAPFAWKTGRFCFSSAETIPPWAHHFTFPGTEVVLEVLRRLDEKGLLLQENAKSGDHLLGASRDFVIPEGLFPRQSLAAIGVGVVAAEPEGGIVFLNSVAEELTGWLESEARTKRIEQIFQPRDLGGLARPTPRRQGTTSTGMPEEGSLRRRDGCQIPIEFSVACCRGWDGRITGLIVVFRSLSNQRRVSLQVERLTGQDPLTGLLNRRSFVDCLEEYLIKGRGECSRDAILCCIDIDQLRLVNETCGHDAGDLLLQWVAAQLREVSRPGDILARGSGDQFLVLLRETSTADAVRFARQFALRLRQVVFPWDDKSFSVSVCSGLVPLLESSSSARSLLSAADHSSRVAKERGRGAVYVFESEPVGGTDRLDAAQWAARIDRELTSGSAVLYAQPIVPLVPSRWPGIRLEVLLRIAASDGRVCSPTEVIRAAERYELMPRLDRWVTERVVRSLAKRRGAERSVEVCFINLSASTLRDHSFLDYVAEVCEDSGVSPSTIGFEVTETAAIHDIEQVRSVMQELAALGCRLALDDFGTGTASYAHLRALPVEFLKIDGIFIEGMETSGLDRALVESITHVSHVVGMLTIAERVSRESLLSRARELGIDFAQGFCICHPAPLATFL